MISPLQNDFQKIKNKNLITTKSHQPLIQNIVAKRGFLFGGSITPSSTVPHGKEKFEARNFQKSKSGLELNEEDVEIEKGNTSNYSINWARLMTQNTKKTTFSPQKFEH
jgi:hypothetical protein